MQRREGRPASNPKGFQQVGVGIWRVALARAACVPRNFTTMSEHSTGQAPRKMIRWDRLGLLALILVGCSSGMVALVGGTEAEEDAFTRLTHPKPVVALKKKEAHPVLLRQASQPANEESPEEETTGMLDRDVSPTPEQAPAPQPAPQAAPEPKPDPKTKAKKVRDKTILPCSVCKKTMRVPRNPYTAHQLSLIHISEPTRRTPISYAVFCLKKKIAWA